MNRQCIEDVTIGNYTIPKGSIILMSQYVMQRDARYFENPDQFIPERWTPEFEKALPKWPTLRNPRAWLHRVAQHEALARCEAVRREVPVDVVPDRPDQLSAALAAELRAEQREVMAHLRGLPPKQRQVMTWTLAGFGDAEIADALGLSTDAVKQSRYYARRNLVKRLGFARRDSR